PGAASSRSKCKKATRGRDACTSELALRRPSTARPPEGLFITGSCSEAASKSGLNRREALLRDADERSLDVAARRSVAAAQRRVERAHAPGHAHRADGRVRPAVAVLSRPRALGIAARPRARRSGAQRRAAVLVPQVHGRRALQIGSGGKRELVLRRVP